MADTCSGIYFWSWSTRPPCPRLARSGCPRTSPGTRSFSPIEFNGYPRRLIYWMRSFAPPARNGFATVAHRCRPLRSRGGGSLRFYPIAKKFPFLRAWKFASSPHFTFFLDGEREDPGDRMKVCDRSFFQVLICVI